MRILVISNYYPPFELGGWEQLTRDIVIQIKKRGHQLSVLTSDYQTERVDGSEPDIARVLHLESPDHVHYQPHNVLTRPWHEWQNGRHLTKTVDQFKPDVIFIHGMWNLSHNIPKKAEQLCPGRVVYYMASYWLTEVNAHLAYWSSPPRRPWLRLPKQWIGKLISRTILSNVVVNRLVFPRVLCVSEFMRDHIVEKAGIPRSQTYVVHNGISLDDFAMPLEKNNSSNLRLLYAGRLAEIKGVHTAIESLGYLLRDYQTLPATLSIVGGGVPSYEARLKKRVQELNLAHAVHFLGQVPYEQMPFIFAEHDAMLFTSIWAEPLARAVQEAMACGLVVIGTTTGGTPEILRDGENGLTFEADNAAMLADKIAQLINDKTLAPHLIKAARQTVTERFTLERMIDEIEHHLLQITQLN